MNQSSKLTSPKRWYQKKSYWSLIVLFLIGLIGGKMEFLKMRYQPTHFSQSIQAAVPLPFQFKQKKIAASTIQYCQVGNNSNLPIIVLVHGSPGSLSAYEEYLKDRTFHDRAILIAVDRLGFGYSDFGKAIPSLQLQAQLIASILEDFPQSKKILVGHSMGGPVNSRLAMDYPHLVDGMVLIAPAISPNLEPPNWWRKVIDFPLLRWLTPPALRVCNQEIIPLKNELLAIEDGWEKITCPVTIIQGTADPLVPPGNADYAQKKLVNSKSVKVEMVEDGNHFILWSEIPLIRDAIMEMVLSE